MTPFRPLATYRIQFNENFTFRDALEQIGYFKALGVDTIYASPIFAAVPKSTHGYDVVDPLRINPEIGTERELFELTQALRNSGISWIQDIVPNHMAFHPDNAYLMDVLEKGQNSSYSSFFDLDVDWQNGGKLIVPFLTETPERLIAGGALSIVKKSDKYFIFDGNAHWPVSAETQLGLNETELATINGDKEHLLSLLNSQYYQLCDYQSAGHVVNYRRFFTVNGLICLNMQEKWVFEAYHQYIFQLVKNGIFQGLRIDHIDGLFDPTAYLKALRLSVGPGCYITVEKILAPCENLPANWPVQGSTGYDFMAQLNNLFTRSSTIAHFDEIYGEVTGKVQSPSENKLVKKQFVLALEMRGELRRLAKMLIKMTGENLSFHQAEAYVEDILVSMPVYRFYDITFPLKGEELSQIEALLVRLENTAADAKSASFWKIWLLEFPLKASAAELDELTAFFARLMQFSGPVMAKGIEDTLMYTYNRFTAHAEVGDQAESFGISVADFHALMKERQQQQPFSLNATSTHDTKKGEDVRARLNVLSDMPGDWREAIKGVMEQYAAAILSIHPNDLYLLMQILLGIYPWNQQDREDLPERLGSFMEKALREGKKRSGWAEPDGRYEQQMKDFIGKLCNDLESTDHPLIKLLAKIRGHAAVNTISQVILKVCAPGVPDFYQGTEAFDLSLVDPDNRRPVDYGYLTTQANQYQHADATAAWTDHLEDSGKITLVQRLLRIRKTYRSAFEQGDYIPLEITGKYKDHALAFLRRGAEDWVLVAIPLGSGYLTGAGGDIMSFDWADTRINLPADAPKRWKNLLNAEPVTEDVLYDGLPLSGVFKAVQGGVCVPVITTRERSSGVLMHISSLPSSGAVGNFGPSAYQFVDFLQAASQRYWQILPLSAVSELQGYSPYATWSDRAGNLQFIAPDVLREWGLLEKVPQVQGYGLAEQADFLRADAEIEMLLGKAFEAFNNGAGSPELQKAFVDFCAAQSSWLNDYALYRSLTLAFKGSWRTWPDEFKWREDVALEKYQREYAAQLERYRWEQFIFWEQWHHLKAYANKRGIKIIGDLPFYLDLDSIEVWCNPQYFKLDGEGEPLFQAGVPPDYFNSKGQLWGMPVYNWEKIAADGYTWWLDRIAYQLSRVDELRLDHFRAFSSFYQVAGGSTNARKGTWEESPGHSLLSRLRDRLGKLPLIAEDLGDITPAVRELMEDFELPGMKVLQFAFDAGLLISLHLPHAENFHKGIVYTGTHDNNTTRGWFNQDLDLNAKKRLEAYLGQPCGEKDIAHQLIRLAQSSPAARVILPMQDILGLDQAARMNRPGTASGNWSWRLKGDEDYKAIAKKLKLISKLYGRTE